MFVGTTNLRNLLQGKDIVYPFIATRIKHGAYELSLGDEVFQTGISESKKGLKKLAVDEKIEIQPGQFALLLTEEYVKIPGNKIAFISIKAGIKFKGLINVSGFHVDPGFEGKLLFSVYNAGPSSIILNRGTAYFPMWLAELNETQDYEGKHDKQIHIPNEPVEALSQGELASPSALSKRIDRVDDLKKKIEWVVLAIFAFLVALLVKVWTDKTDLTKAVEYGYDKAKQEERFDSLNLVRDVQVRALKDQLDSLKARVSSKKVANPAKEGSKPVRKTEGN